MKKAILAAIVTAILWLPTMAQMHCGFDSLLAYNRLHNPGFDSLIRQTDFQINDFIGTYINPGGPSPNSVIPIFPPANYVIPVVVHVMHSGTPEGVGVNISFAQIESQIDALNAAFAAGYGSTNFQNGQSHPFYARNTTIQFCLAQNAPIGVSWTNPGQPGVMRYNVQSTYSATNIGISLPSGILPMTSNSIPFPYANYLNVWVVTSISDGNPSNVIQGFATFPQNTYYPFDGVIIRSDVFGNNTLGGSFPLNSLLNEGKVLAHEVGHYFNLYHTFHTDGSSLCEGTDPFSPINAGDPCNFKGDRICDIEPCQEVNGNCVSNTCTANYVTGTTTNDMQESYMSYADDGCWNTFTQDQTNRMVAALNLYRDQLWTTSNLYQTGLLGGNGCVPNQLISSITIDPGSIACTNQPVDFWNPSSTQGNTATTWSWSITPAGASPATGSSSSLSNVLFSMPGTYTVSLTVSDGTATSTGSVQLLVTDCNINPSFANQCQWHFGYNCLFDFATGIAVPGLPSQTSIRSHEPASSVCHSNGNVIYTDGMTVWNNNNTPMTGLGGVLGGTVNAPPYRSSRQGALVVPAPANSQRYYVFTVPDQPSNNIYDVLKYSIVDMTLNGGLGEIVTINTPVPGPQIFSTEALTAIPHCNGQDYWIIIHGASPGLNSSIYAYLLTPFGITGPVASPSGVTIPSPAVLQSDFGAYIAYFETSRDASLLAFTVNISPQTIRLYSFDNATGVFTSVSNIATPVGSASAGGTCFSPNSRLLYAPASNNRIIQYDLTNIVSPTFTSTTVPGLPFILGDPIQLGPDDHIYIGHAMNHASGMILNPNTLNSGNNTNEMLAVSNAIQFDPGSTILGSYPNYVKAAKPAQLTTAFTVTSTNCNVVTLEVDDCWSLYTATWDFGDGSPTVTGNVVTHAFSSAGNYNVTVTLSILGGTLPPFAQTVTVGLSPQSISGPTQVCPNNPTAYVYSVPQVSGATYTWNLSPNGTIVVNNGNEIHVNWGAGPTGTVSVTLASAGCTTTVSINVSFFQVTASAGPDQTICVGGQVALNSASCNGTATWAPAAGLSCINCQNPTVTGISPGAQTYSMTCTDANGCIVTDQVTINVLSCCTADHYLIAQPGQTFPISTYGSPILPGQSVFVSGDLIIDVPTFTFDNNRVLFNVNSSVHIQNNQSLRIQNGSLLKACTNMWKGIFIDATANPGNTNLTVDNSTIRDAVSAVVSNNGGVFKIQNGSRFQDNLTSLTVNPYSAGPHGGFVWNTTFERVNGLLPPNLGAGQTGIMIQNVTGGITIGDVSTAGHGNFFSNLLYGIRTNASKTFIQNNSFQNMLPQSFALNPQGAAVYAQGNSDLAYLRLDNLNSVQNARWGVYTQGVMESFVEDNSFKKISGAGVYSVNNKHQVMVKRNVVHDFQLLGIAGVDNGGSHFLENNTITNPNPVQNSLGTAISYQNAITGMTLKITNDNKTQNVRTGIHAVNIGLLTVEGNPNINFSPGSSTAPGYGVRLINCTKALVRQNKIWGSQVNNDRGRPNTYCLHVTSSQAARIELNDLRHARFGFWGTQALNGDNLLCNTITNCEVGVELSGVPNGAFGPVGWFSGGSWRPSDNQWRATGPQAVSVHTNMVNASNGPSFPWYVRANAPSPFITYPLVNQNNPPAVSILPTLTTGPSPCNPGPIAGPANANGGQGLVMCQDPPCREKIFKDLVTGQVSYPAFQAEHEWRGKYFTYKSFKADPVWLSLGTPDDTLFQAFYAATEPTNIGDIVKIEEMVEVDSITSATMVNSSLAPTNLIESNQKRLNEIYLSTWAMLVDTFTTVEEHDLLAIANQCPTMGGNAVFGARVMLGLDILDSCQMSIANKYSSSIGQITGYLPTFRLYPNPSAGNFLLEIGDFDTERLNCTIKDLTGRIVFHSQFPFGEHVLEINLSSSPSGVYLIECFGANGSLFKEKMVIHR